MDPEETVTLKKSEYEELLMREAWADALDDAGVDNWQGIDFAQDRYREMLKELNLDDE